MRFGEPIYLFFLAFPVLTLLFYIWAGKRRRLSAESFVGKTLLSRLVPQRVWEQQRKKAALIVVALFFIILALAQPRWGYQWEDLKQEGVDIIVALDVSNSMLATDIKPSRLERAKHEVADLIRMLDGDRIGLVAFAGTSFLQCPLTLDYNAAELFLNAFDTDLIPVQGTALGHAIRTAIRGFSQIEKKSRVILLITDGEDHEGDALAAARQAKEEGVRIFVIGVGQEGGAPIPDPASGGFKKDERGEVILSRFNESLLQQIAVMTGGTYVRSVAGDMDLVRIYQEDIKQRIEKKELRTSRRKRWQERFQWMLAAALLLLTLERAVRER